MINENHISKINMNNMNISNNKMISKVNKTIKIVSPGLIIDSKNSTLIL